MTQSPSGEVHDAIAAANEHFRAAVKRGDAGGVADLHTENGQALPPNSDSVTGKPAVRASCQAILDMGVKEARLDIVGTDRGSSRLRRPAT